ncbi:S-layer homology domain-containing protein [Paenibacillus aestuarii]|uniref:S-layer homology domain-containing protein n=1 Tax=Paenibacillus aestuarii TaxID=516965 RepID=A0ABW0KGB2_9BACL|nr:S-layer homology domain-containing protein [Paenibacillus aestuarii]
MKKRLLSIAAAGSLVLTLLPSAMLAATPVTLTDITNKYQGETVTISGTSSDNDVIIKVIRPDNTVLYYDDVPTNMGSYSQSFTLPADAAVGTYTVVAGIGTNVDTDVFSVISTSGSNDSGNSGSSNGGGGGSGGGSTSSTNSNTISISNGGTVRLNGATIDVPAGALDGTNLTITVNRLSNPSGLPMNAGSLLVSDVFDITKNIPGLFTKAVRITLPFDASKVDQDHSNVGIYWLNETFNTWIKLDDNQVDMTNGTVSASVNHFTKFAVLASKPEGQAIALKFSDLNGHWAEQNIKKLVEMGVIDGYSDGTFKPDNNMTRAEFVSIIVKAFNLQTQEGKVFADTTNHWAKSLIATAAANVIISGYSDSEFAPNDLVTREQIASMLVKATHMDLASSNLTFKDQDEISDWAQDAINTVTAKGLMDGYQDGTLKPQGNATRAEAATLLLRILQQAK